MGDVDDASREPLEIGHLPRPVEGVAHGVVVVGDPVQRTGQERHLPQHVGAPAGVAAVDRVIGPARLDDGRRQRNEAHVVQHPGDADVPHVSGPEAEALGHVVRHARDPVAVTGEVGRLRLDGGDEHVEGPFAGLALLAVLPVGPPGAQHRQEDEGGTERAEPHRKPEDDEEEGQHAVADHGEAASAEEAQDEGPNRCPVRDLDDAGEEYRVEEGEDDVHDDQG